MPLFNMSLLSRSGAVFGWGKNSHGQLGLQDRENRCYPTHLKTLRNVKVIKFLVIIKVASVCPFLYLNPRELQV